MRWKICERFDDKAPVLAYAPVSDFGHIPPAGAHARARARARSHRCAKSQMLSIDDWGGGRIAAAWPNLGMVEEI